MAFPEMKEPTGSISINSRKRRVNRAASELRRVFASARRQMIAKVNAKGEVKLSGAQRWALSQVQAQPGLTVFELAERLSLYQSTTSNLVEKLDSAGCLRRRRDPENGRIVRLFVTSRGAKILSSGPDLAGGRLPEALRRLSSRELAALELALQSLLREFGKDESGSE